MRRGLMVGLVAVLGLAVLLLQGLDPAGRGPAQTAEAATSGTRLVLESVDVDRAGIVFPEAWTASQGSARFAAYYGTADFAFPIPSAIPPEGAPVTLTVGVNGTQEYIASALGIHGDATFAGEATEVGTSAPAGQSATRSITITITPRPAAAGAKVLIFVGLLGGPRVNYRFRAESTGCTTAQERAPGDGASALQSACAPPRCAGVAATVVDDPRVPGAIVGTPERDVIVGTADNDLILARSGNDLVCGGGGNDRILGNAGADTINGEAGDDRIEGGGDASRDRLAGQAGDDRILAGGGDDLLVGGRGDDVLVGGADRDRMDAGPGRDVLFGEGEADLMLGGDDFDRMLGGPGNDVMEGGEGPDRLTGQTGDDRLFGQDGSDLLLGGPGDDHLDGGRSGDGGVQTGGPGSDRCVGDGASRALECERG